MKHLVSSAGSIRGKKTQYLSLLCLMFCDFRVINIASFPRCLDLAPFGSELG